MYRVAVIALTILSDTSRGCASTSTGTGSTTGSSNNGLPEPGTMATQQLYKQRTILRHLFYRKRISKVGSVSCFVLVLNKQATAAANTMLCNERV